jgi:hypothetical protein
MISLIVAITLVEDYVLTIVVSALSGGDQLLSILNLYGKNWVYHFLLGALFAAVTWYLTIRGRGESSRVVFTLLGVFLFLTVTMAIGLFIAKANGFPPVAVTEAPETVSLGQALMHLLAASMKGMVALTGLEAVSNGVQFFINQDVSLVKWGKKHMPRLNKVWDFYSGKSGIGRFVQTSFLFYGGLTTYFLTYFALHFNVFDGTLGRTLVGNLAYIGFTQLPGGVILFWAYQILAVLMLSAASMTALQDAQATEWRDVAIGEIPEIIIYRDRRGTHSFRHDHFHCRCDYHVPRAWADHTCRPILFNRRVSADHGYGAGNPQAYIGAWHWPRAGMGCEGGRFFSHAVGDGFPGPDLW